MSTARRLRGLVGAGGLVLTAGVAWRSGAGPLESRVFRVINDLPDGLYRPAWVVMQCGALGAAPLVGGGALLAGDSDLAARAVVGGTGAWILAKVVKRTVGRARPGQLLPRTRVRGRAATGLGYLSGHAAVATVLATVLARGAPGQDTPAAAGSAAAAALLVTVVGGARIYVGAHLPLDVAGGIFLGLVVESLLPG